MLCVSLCVCETLMEAVPECSGFSTTVLVKNFIYATVNGYFEDGGSCTDGSVTIGRKTHADVKHPL